MKKIVLGVLLVVTSTTYAQKDELKNAEQKEQIKRLKKSLVYLEELMVNQLFYTIIFLILVILILMVIQMVKVMALFQMETIMMVHG